MLDNWPCIACQSVYMLCMAWWTSHKSSYRLRGDAPSNAYSKDKSAMPNHWHEHMDQSTTACSPPYTLHCTISRHAAKQVSYSSLASFIAWACVLSYMWLSIACCLLTFMYLPSFAAGVHHVLSAPTHKGNGEESGYTNCVRKLNNMLIASTTYPKPPPTPCEWREK